MKLILEDITEEQFRRLALAEKMIEVIYDWDQHLRTLDKYSEDREISISDLRDTWIDMKYGIDLDELYR